MFRTRKFEPGLNRGLAIQGKIAICAKDSPAAQISPSWPFAPDQRELLIGGRVAEAAEQGQARRPERLSGIGRWSERGRGARW